MQAVACETSCSQVAGTFLSLGPMIRLFAALSLPEAICTPLLARQTGLAGARWRPQEAFHITLRFVGEIREDLARDLDLELEQIVLPSMNLRLDGVGAFGEGREIHAVWAGVSESPELSRLNKACERACRTVGIEADGRKYRPHVTLAYLRHPDPVDVAAWLETHALLKSEPFEVSRFGLYSSQLSPQGSRYRLEQTYDLEATA